MTPPSTGLAARLEPLDCDQGGQVVFLTRAQLDRIRRDAFDRGYRQGQDDCRSAETRERERLVMAAAQGLADAAFAWSEARQAAVQALRPLVEALVGRFLPELAERTLPDLVAEQALQLAGAATDGPLRLLCAPEAAEAIGAALCDAGLPAGVFEVVPQPGFSPRECRIALPEGELRIDADGVLARLRDTLTALHGDNRKENVNG